MIEKRGNKWCTISCNHDPGKVISCFPTKSKAEKQHAAIMSTKIRKIEINLRKSQRGTREGRVTVRRGGKIFQRRQRLGVKGVEPKPKGSFTMVGPNDLDAFVKEWTDAGHDLPNVGHEEMSWGDRIIVRRDGEGSPEAYAHLCLGEQQKSWNEFREWDETPASITKEGPIKVVGLEWIESHSPGAGRAIMEELLSKYDLVMAGMTTPSGSTLMTDVLKDHFGWTGKSDLGTMYSILGTKEQARQGIDNSGLKT